MPPVSSFMPLGPVPKAPTTFSMTATFMYQLFDKIEISSIFHSVSICYFQEGSTLTAISPTSVSNIVG